MAKFNFSFKFLKNTFVYLLACCLLAGVLFSRTSVFRVSNFEIDVDDSGIKDLVTKKLIPHLGGSLLSIPVKKIERELLNIPKVKNIRIMRSWPNSLGVQIETNKPVGKFKSKTGINLVDDAGRILEKGEEASKFPWLVGFYDFGTANPQLEEDQIKSILTWVSSLQNKKNLSPIDAAQISQIEWAPGGGLSFHLGADWPLKIDLGFNDWDRTWSRVLVLWTQESFKPLQFESLDASYTNRIVAKKRRELPKTPNELNLEELVRRGEGSVQPEVR